MTEPRILVFAGSVRQGSINEKLAALVAAALSEAGAAPTHISLKDYALPLYDGDLQARDGVPDAAARLVELFRQHHGVFIASPEYNASFPPLVKNTFDWMSRVSVAGQPQPGPFKRRVFALGAASNGAMGGYRGLTQLRAMMELGLGANVQPEMVSVPHAGEAIAPDGTLSNPRTAEFLASVVATLVANARSAA
jgi:chromate reductase